MNRLQFLKELRKSFIDTTKEITLPVLDGEFKKIDDIADKIVGLNWVKVGSIDHLNKGIQERFINGASILLFHNGEELIAYQKTCSSCQSLVQWIAHEKKLKCFSCDRTYLIESEAGDLVIKRYYTKAKNREWFIGM